MLSKFFMIFWHLLLQSFCSFAIEQFNTFFANSTILHTVLKCPIHHKLEHIFIKRKTSYCSCKKTAIVRICVVLFAIIIIHYSKKQVVNLKRLFFFLSDKIVLQCNGRTVFKSIGSDCALLQRVRIRSKTSLFDFWVSNEHQERRLE